MQFCNDLWLFCVQVILLALKPAYLAGSQHRPALGQRSCESMQRMGKRHFEGISCSFSDHFLEWQVQCQNVTGEDEQFCQLHRLPAPCYLTSWMFVNINVGSFPNYDVYWTSFCHGWRNDLQTLICSPHFISISKGGLAQQHIGTTTGYLYSLPFMIPRKTQMG